ncbi:MAG: ABC transporter permease [Dehalococcoidales bacterium]|jgi:ABC-type dipeptide/oligopeptide/nickel transport system permease subunit
MAVDASFRNEMTEIAPRVSEWKRFYKVFFSRGIVMFGLVIIVLFIFVAIFARQLAPYGPNDIDMNATLQNPTAAHWLGTDALGRDTLSRIIYGTRVSLEIGLIVVGIGTVIGMALGTIAGYFGGWVYTIIMRSIDALMCFPMIILVLLIASMLGPGMRNLIIALTVGLMPGYARLMCGQVLTVKQEDYILAARSLGSSNTRIIMRHIVMNCLPPLIVQITMMLGATILAEAGMSFLGIGIQQPTATWGGMITNGRQYLTNHPVLSLAPGLALMLVVFASNIVGDGLRDALDPRLRGQI